VPNTSSLPPPRLVGPRCAWRSSPDVILSRTSTASPVA
jgi:hypothetical protein